MINGDAALAAPLRTCRCLALAAALVLASALAAGPANAQIGATFQSLEWLVADSTLVVRASVAGVVREPPVEQTGWVTVTLAVRETLKGEPTTTLTFAESVFATDKRYEGWRDAGREQLWFLVPNEEYVRQAGAEAPPLSARWPWKPRGAGWSMLRLGTPVPEERGFVPLPPPIFTMDLVVASDAEEVLKAVRAAASLERKPGAARGHSMTLPSSVARRSERAGDANTLTMPMDARLETLARRLIGAPAGFLPAGHHPFERDLLRLEGVKALRHFKSKANTAILTPLLKDTAPWNIIRPDGTQVREYSIREEARAVLREWAGQVEGVPQAP